MTEPAEDVLPRAEGERDEARATDAYKRVRPGPASPCSTSTCGNEACAKELRHVFHNRLDEQQRKEGEQEPCALCGRMLDAAIHASPEPGESKQDVQDDDYDDEAHAEKLSIALGTICAYCGQPKSSPAPIWCVRQHLEAIR